MLRHKKFFITILCLTLFSSVFLLSSCSNKNSVDHEKNVDFPLDNKGYPQNDVVIINGGPHQINLKENSHIAFKANTEIEVKLGEDKNEVEITLPQYLPINTWSVSEENFINLNSYSKTIYPVKDENMLEGISSTVQKFNIEVAEGQTTELFFKWANINESNKLFKDKNEDYLLKIVVSY